MPFEAAGRAGEAIGREGEDEDLPLEAPHPDEQPADVRTDVAAKGHGISEAERAPVVPQPAPLNPISPTPHAQRSITRSLQGPNAARPW